MGEVGGPCKSAKNGNDMKWSSFQSEGDSFQMFFCLCLFLFFALGEVGLDFGFSTSMGVRVNETTFLDAFTKNGSCVGWCFKDCLFFD